MIEQDPSPEKIQQYFGIGGIIAGAATALWARLVSPSKDEIKQMFREMLDEHYREQRLSALERQARHERE